MSANGAALSHLIKSCSVEGRAIVAEVRRRKRRCMIETGVDAIAGVWGERIVGAVDGRSEGDRRQLLISAQRFQRRQIANAEVDAEVDVARVDLADLEPVVQAHRRPLGHVSREAQTRSVTAIDVDAGCAASMREHADAEGIVRGSERWLSEVDARVVGGDEIARQRAGWRDGRALKDAASAEGPSEQISDD